MTLSDILADFELLEEWEDRYRYVIELGRGLELLPEDARTHANKVRGCVSQVWLTTAAESAEPDYAPRLHFTGDSDANIVRGLIAILFVIYCGKRANEILDIDAHAIFNRMGLKDHLTPQRSNGFAAMVERIRLYARISMERQSSTHGNLGHHRRVSRETSKPSQLSQIS